MTKKTQKQSAPEELMAQFAALWQQKWMEMLHEKGWPTEMPAPSMATMPFLNPFMMPHMGPGMDSGPGLHTRLAALEERVAKLEKTKASSSKSKTKPKRT